MTNKSEAIERQLVVQKLFVFTFVLSYGFARWTAFQSKTNFSVLFVFTFSLW
jgi:hypothetical protein